MTYSSLLGVLEEWFDTGKESLPKELRIRVERDFPPVDWSLLTAEQRRYRAEEWDYQHDPAREGERTYWFEHFLRVETIEAQIEQWSAIPASSASELALKETRLGELQSGLTKLKDIERNSTRQSYVKQQNIPPASSVKPKYIPYPRAMMLLQKRIAASPQELAAWIFFGQRLGGLDAYVNANEIDPPPRFYYAYYSGTSDYIAPLMGCWFDEKEINNFNPSERYLLGSTLLERWSTLSYIDPKEFILAKIRESRIMDCHPTFGGTSASFSDMGSFPPLEAGLFPLSQIEEIERTDFGDPEPEVGVVVPLKQQGHLNHDPEMQRRANEIAASLTTNGRLPTKDKVAKKLAAELGITKETALRRIRADWKKKS